MSEGKKRICLYDNLKFLLIILVAVGHFADRHTADFGSFRGLFLFIYAFHMPLFLFVSGQFHKNKDIIRKVVSYTFVGILLKVVLSLMPFILYGTAPKFTLLSDSGLPWFMFVLAIYQVLSYVLRDVDKRLVIVIFVILACFAGYDRTVGDKLWLSRTIVFYPFYVLGEALPKEKVVEFTRKKWVRASAVAVLAGWGVAAFAFLQQTYCLRKLFTGRNSFYFNETFSKWGFAFRLLCYLITFLTSAAVIAIVSDKKIPVITTFGSRSIQVYFWHRAVMMIMIKTGLDKIICTSAPMGILWLLCAVAVVFILSLKPFGFPVNQVMKAAGKARQ